MELPLRIVRRIGPGDRVRLSLRIGNYTLAEAAVEANQTETETAQRLWATRAATCAVWALNQDGLKVTTQ